MITTGHTPLTPPPSYGGNCWTEEARDTTWGVWPQFEDYAKHYYNIVPSTTSTLEHQIACENLDTFQTLQLAEVQNRPPEPIHVCITNASCPLAYQLAPRLLIDQVFGNNKIHLHLYDTTPNLPFLEGVAMELQDMAHPSPLMHHLY